MCHGVAPAPSLLLFVFILECLLTEVRFSSPVQSSWTPPPTFPDKAHLWPPHPDSYEGLRDVAPACCTLRDASSPQPASPSGTGENHLVPGKATLKPRWWKSNSKVTDDVLRLSSGWWRHFYPSSSVDAELFRAKVISKPFTAANSLPDPFGEDPLLRPQINGRESSPEMSDLSRLAPPVGALPARLCRTPEAFLGPTGASLVNLDALIPSNPPTKMHKNPFLSGTTKLLGSERRHYFVIILFLFRFHQSVSRQPFPLRPSSPYPQPAEVFLYITAASTHGVLQPVSAAAPVPADAHPALLSYPTCCRTPGPAI